MSPTGQRSVAVPWLTLVAMAGLYLSTFGRANGSPWFGLLGQACFGLALLG